MIGVYKTVSVLALYQFLKQTYFLTGAERILQQSVCEMIGHVNPSLKYCIFMISTDYSIKFVELMYLQFTAGVIPTQLLQKIFICLKTNQNRDSLQETTSKLPPNANNLQVHQISKCLDGSQSKLWRAMDMLKNNFLTKKKTLFHTMNVFFSSFSL